MLSRRDFLKTAVAAAGGAAFLRASPLSGYPYVQNLCRGRASIVWRSPVDGLGTVEFSDDLSFSSRVEARVKELLPQETGLPDPIYLYRANLTNLSPSTDYHYRVSLDDSRLTFGDGFRFRTGGPGAFDFLVFGDCGAGTQHQSDLAQRMLGENAALALITGDLVYTNGSYAEYEKNFFPYYGEMMRRLPFFPTPGNHDYHTPNARPYLAMNALPTEDIPITDRGLYYSFDWGNVHFVSLDTNDALRDAAGGNGGMLEWFEKDLEKSNHFWRVVYFHHPPYASGHHDFDPIVKRVRDYIVPILDRHKVDLVFTGHEHSYQRTYPIRNGKFLESGEGTVYVTTGGGGGNLYLVRRTPRLAVGESAHHYVRTEVQGASMTMRAIRIDGSEIDRFTLMPAPVICASFLTPREATTALEWNSPVVAIHGRHLASEEKQARKLPLPRTLGGTRVTMYGRSLPLLSVSGTKIEVQLPHMRHWGQLRVETPNGSAEIDVVFSEQPDYQLCK